MIPAGRRLLALDLTLVLWVAVWLILALQVAQEVRGLAELSTTVSRVGTAVEESGRVLSGLEELPLGVGDRLEEPARRIEEAGRSAVSSGSSSRDSVESLSVLLGLALAVIPSLPVFGFYLPLRLGHVRERRALLGAIESARGDALEEFLARRAVERLSYRRLRRVSAEPWRDLAAGHYRALACAELERFGLGARVLDQPRGS